MRRNQDDKRVLRSGNGRQSHSRNKQSKRHFLPRTQKNQNVYNSSRNYKNRRNKKKRSNKVVFIMIVALVAFVIGAGIGVSLSFENNNNDVDEGPHFENVTNEMTSNLNSTKDVSYDKSVDGVDYNQNKTSQLNVKNNSKNK